MKKTDFMIVYEVKQRELEPCVLLKTELERRGYSVELEAGNCIASTKPKYDAEVVVLTHLSYKYLNFGNACAFRKAIYIPPEQLYKDFAFKFDFDDREILMHTPIPIVTWGDALKDYLINNKGMPEWQVVVAGAPAMDFIKPKFSDYYMNKIQTAQKYKIDGRRKWTLFISSFSYKIENVNYAPKHATGLETSYSAKAYSIELETRRRLYRWFEEALNNSPDTVFIYRPHPNEIISYELTMLEKKYRSFLIIRKESVRQWIKVCDKIFTWISTSVAEAYFLNKPVYVVRPVKIEKKNELSPITLEDYDYIETCEGFLKAFRNWADDAHSSKTVDDKMRYYYSFAENVYTYEAIADLCAKVIADDGYVIPDDIIQTIKSNQTIWLKNIGIKTKMGLFLRRWPVADLYYKFFARGEANNRINKADIDEIETKVRKCLE